MSNGRILFGLIAITLGCTKPQVSEPVMPQEESFAQQVAAVAAGESDSIEVQAALLSDDDLSQIANLETLRQLKLSGPGKLSSTGLVHLESLSQLEHLKLGGMRIDDAAAARIAKLSQLQFLNLPETTLTDDGLLSLTALQSLKLLRLDASQVTDAGLEHLKALPKLRFLHLIHPNITGQGLDTIAELEQLESLYLDGVDLPHDAWARLIAARPGLHIHVDQLHLPQDPKATDHTH